MNLRERSRPDGRSDSTWGKPSKHCDVCDRDYEDADGCEHCFRDKENKEDEDDE